MIYSDETLSQKLERTEARVNAGFVETRARLDPGCGAAWIEVGGAYAMFDGAESPLTQTFGLGVFDETTPEHLDEIEAFFRERKAPIFHEVSPMGDPSLMGLLSERGYRPIAYQCWPERARSLAAAIAVHRPRFLKTASNSPQHGDVISP